MRTIEKFVLKTLGISFCALLMIILIGHQADGKSDPFYLRFTTPKKSNLILGTSRAAQGILPNVLGESLNREFFNYSFTIDHSPYGNVYLKSVKKKLLSATENGIFIVQIDPWSISSVTENPYDSINFRENNLCLGQTPFVNVDPNYFYLLNSYQDKYYNLIIPTRSSTFLHKDGWLEVSLSMDSERVKNRMNITFDRYRNGRFKKYKFSEYRLLQLKRTIKFLQKHGEVYLVRLPTHPEMHSIDLKLMPDFDIEIKEIINISNGYFDMTSFNSEYEYTDGLHLHKDSGYHVTMKIANWIKRKRLINR